jgi:hypothetical protein
MLAYQQAGNFNFTALSTLIYPYIPPYIPLIYRVYKRLDTHRCTMSAHPSYYQSPRSNYYNYKIINKVKYNQTFLI